MGTFTDSSETQVFKNVPTWTCLLASCFYVVVHWEDFNGISYLITFRSRECYIAMCARVSRVNKAWTPRDSTHLEGQPQYLIMSVIAETKIHHRLLLKPSNHGELYED